MGKTFDGIKTSVSIAGAIKNKVDHNRFEEGIAHAQRMALFSNSSANSATTLVSHLQGNLNNAWHYIKQNFENIRRLFNSHNSLVIKHNHLCKTVSEQQKQINELRQEVKKLKGEVK